MDALKLMTAKDTLIFFHSNRHIFTTFTPVVIKAFSMSWSELVMIVVVGLNGLLGATWVRTEEEGGALLDGSFLSRYGLMARGR